MYLYLTAHRRTYADAMWHKPSKRRAVNVNLFIQERRLFVDTHTANFLIPISFVSTISHYQFRTLCHQSWKI